MTGASSPVSIVRIRNGTRQGASDVTAAEVPLELRLQDRPFAVIMRTPGAEASLAAGFLLAERIIRGADDLAAIEHCRDAGDAGASRENIVSVTLVPAAATRAEALLAGRRDVMANASCGVCGRATIDSLRTGLDPLSDGSTVPLAVVMALPRQLRARQPLFEQTGGLHAAGIFDRAGRLLAVAEDVGRHNAVDKVVGSLLLRDGLPPPPSVLCVSGRASFEIVQKAWCAGITIVAAVSAPSSLAVSLAAEAGITLAGFVRDDGLNIYTAPARLSQA